MNQLIHFYGPKLIYGLLSIIIAGFVNYVLPKVPGVTQHLIDMAKHKVGGLKNTYVQGILNRIITLGGQKVLMLENTEIQAIKAQAAAGKITPDQLPSLLQAVKVKAINSVKEDASAQGIWGSATSVFGGNETALLKWLGDAIESQVAQLPSSGLQTVSITSSPLATPAMSSAPVAPAAAKI